MLYYHLSPRKNKNRILEEGLHSDSHIFLADSIYDAVILAPVMGRYYYAYDFWKDIYNNGMQALRYSWAEYEYQFSVFEIDGNGLRITKHPAGQIKFYERHYKTKLGPNRIIYEYWVDKVPSHCIRLYTDYSAPFLKIEANGTIAEECQREHRNLIEAQQMLDDGIPIDRVREMRLPAFPQKLTPSNINDFVVRE